MVLQDPFDDLAEVDGKSHSSSDEDFNPAAVPAEDSPSSSSSDEEAPVAAPAAKPTQRKRKRKAPPPEELDSGDEVTIEAARKRKAKRRKGDKGGDEDDLILSDDEGGEGGLIKTRAQRRGEEKERRPLAGIEGATVDVESLWAQMSAAPLRPAYAYPANEAEKEKVGNRDVAVESVTTGISDKEEDLVSIRKIYTFAGQRTTEEKDVPRPSLDQYLKDGWREAEDAVEPTEITDDKEAIKAKETPESLVRRPLRRPSRFDPNPTGYVRALPPEFQLSWPRKTETTTANQENIPVPPEATRSARPEKAQKLNVVDKSRLDWTGFVVKEGIAEELDVHGKTKEAYLGRMEFLAGVEAKQQEERLRVKAAKTSLSGC